MSTPASQIDPENYTSLLNEKCKAITSAFEALGAPSPDIFSSPSLHFRMRAEFRVWHSRDEDDNSHCFYAMFDPQEPRKAIKVEQFPIVSTSIHSLMSPLMQDINADATLAKKLFQVEFLSSTLGEIVVTLIYHRQLDEQWQQCARQLQDKHNIAIIGRARKQKLVLSKDYVTERIEILDKTYSYQQKENSFTQPNAAINQKMIEWCSQYLASTKTNIQRDSMLEMYCGNGNFTLALAGYFKRVLATEISKTSIASAKENTKTNQVENICFVRLSGEETAQALNRTRPFRRLADIDLDAYQFSTVFVDPPRAGLDESTIEFVQQFNEIIYISCNPETLAKNVKQLNTSHDIIKFAIFDQFPYTQHAECGVVLRKHDA